MRQRLGGLMLAGLVGLGLVGLGLVGLGLVGGCDKKSSSPEVVPSTGPSVVFKSGVKQPTTEELMTSPRTHLSLAEAVVPLTITVPSGWAIKHEGDGGRTTIEGYTPTDLASLRVITQRNLTPDRQADLIDDAKKRMAAQPETATVPVVRTVGPATIIEKITIEQPTTEPVAATTGPTRLVQWSITVCVPDGNRIAAYELRFIGLTLDQYKSDYAFLRPIVDSIAYTPGDKP